MAIMNWWAALTGRATPGAGNVRPTRNADAPATPDWTAMHAPEADARLACWLLGAELDPAAALSYGEAGCIEALDRAVESDSARALLLPRAPQVVPQLLAALRDENVSATTLAQRVARDVVLRAEVLRMANRAHHGIASEVTELPQALSLIGTEGLRQVVTRHVLRPIFDAPAGSLAARTSARVIHLGERKAALCAAIAAAAAQDPFEAYLSGLVHAIGWAVACRALDTAPGPRISHAFADALALRRERLLGRIVAPWQLTPALTELALELGQHGRANPQRPLARTLRLGDTLSALPLMEVGTVDLQALPASVARALRELPPLGE